MRLGMGAMRVPRPAAGMMTITFIAGCKYTRVSRPSSNHPGPSGLNPVSANLGRAGGRPSQRFSHLQHGMVILFVGELPRNLPSPTEIELHGNCIRPNHAKAARLVTTGSYLSFALRE